MTVKRMVEESLAKEVHRAVVEAAVHIVGGVMGELIAGRGADASRQLFRLLGWYPSSVIPSTPPKPAGVFGGVDLT